jgi:hypothetical protein
MPPSRRITDDMLDLARELIAAAGVTMREAAAALECASATLRKYGLRDDAERTRQRCAEFARNLNKRWTPDLIVAAIDAWAERYGAPPAASDWNPAMARAQGRPDRAERHAAGDWPYASTVIRYFGGWSAAIEAAGFPSRPRGSAPSKVTGAMLERARALIAAGASLREAADALEIAPNTLAHYGLRLTDRGEARRQAEILAEVNTRFPVDQQMVPVFGENGQGRPGAYARRRGHRLREAP